MPLSKSQAQVDAFVELEHSPFGTTNVLFQYTVSRTHSFIPERIQAFAHALGWTKPYAFVFVVARKVFSEFKYQNPPQPKSTTEKKPKKAETVFEYVIPQFALKLGGNETWLTLLSKKLDILLQYADIGR